VFIRELSSSIFLPVDRDSSGEPKSVMLLNWMPMERFVTIGLEDDSGAICMSP
jgi:hypothetical protein